MRLIATGRLENLDLVLSVGAVDHITRHPFFFWKERRTRRIVKRDPASWYFTDTGQYCPIGEMERLIRTLPD